MPGSNVLKFQFYSSSVHSILATKSGIVRLKVGLRYFLENALEPDDESEDAVWSMQRELAAAITEIQDGAKEILDKITRRRRQLEKKRWTCHAAYP
jgi:hypothetical protein